MNKINDEAGALQLIKASRMKPQQAAPDFLLRKGDSPGHEFRGNQYTDGGSGGANEAGVGVKEWNGKDTLDRGHIVRLNGDGDVQHVVLEAKDERGDMPRVLVQALGTGMTFAPTERVGREHIMPAQKTKTEKDIEGAKRAGVAVRNAMRRAGNLDGEEERYASGRKEVPKGGASRKGDAGANSNMTADQASKDRYTR